MVKILGKSSSINVRKVLWTCEELGIGYEREDWGSGFQSTDTPAFKALNPNAMVPVLMDGDFVLWESNTICRYLIARQAREDLLPSQPQPRALVEQWMDWQATELNNAWRYAFMSLVRHSAAHADPGALAAGIQGWHDKMQILNDQLARTGAFITGPDFTVADIVLGLSVNRWNMTPMARPDLAAISAYHQRLALRDGFRKFGCNGTP